MSVRPGRNDHENMVISELLTTSWTFSWPTHDENVRVGVRRPADGGEEVRP